MGAPDVLASLTALGVRLYSDGDAIVAEPRSALTETARAMIRAHKAELLAVLAGTADARKARALAYLEAHPEAARVCFADLKADPAHVILTVAVREPWGAVEVLVSRGRFDAFALMELAERYPATSLFVPEH